MASDSPPVTPPHNAPGRAVACWLAVVIVLLGLVLRLAAASNDLWLDEIWTWMTTLQLQSASDVLLRVHDENNHFLNTFCIYFLGPNASGLTYRLPAVASGVISIVLAGAISQRRGSLAAIFSMLLVASSYLLVHYSSEARGYGLVVSCSLLAFWLLDRTLERPSFKTDFAFALVCVLGVLSQPMFVYAYAALGLWWLHHWWGQRQQPKSLRRFVGSAARCHLIPFVFMAWLYAVNIRHMVNGGGPIIALLDVIAQTFSLSIGGPFTGPLCWIAAAVVVVSLIGALIWLKRSRDPRWMFFLLAIFVAPAGLLLAVNRSEVYPRYFLISVAFGSVLMGQSLAELWNRQRAGRVIATAVLLLIVTGNLLHVTRLIQLGRGTYRETIAWMLQQSGSGVLLVGSDHDFRNTMVLSFNQQFFNERIVYYEAQKWPPQGPEWFIRHLIERDIPLEPELSPRPGLKYQLQRIVPYAGLSGWDWAIYRREATATPSPPE